MNELNDEKEAWKQSCCSNSNFNSILLHELDIAREQGFEVSNPFKQFLEDRGDVEMTENKRFKIVDEQFISYYGGTGYKISNEECGFWLWHNKNESQKVCDKLNSILDENRQLKQYNTELINKIDFLERVIDGDV